MEHLDGRIAQPIHRCSHHWPKGAPTAPTGLSGSFLFASGLDRAMVSQQGHGELSGEGFQAILPPPAPDYIFRITTSSAASSGAQVPSLRQYSVSSFSHQACRYPNDDGGLCSPLPLTWPIKGLQTAGAVNVLLILIPGWKFLEPSCLILYH